MPQVPLPFSPIAPRGGVITGRKFFMPSLALPTACFLMIINGRVRDRRQKQKIANPNQQQHRALISYHMETKPPNQLELGLGLDGPRGGVVPRVPRVPPLVQGWIID
jgi:hypothetical protein